MNARAYYNEIDGYAARWLRNLIDAGLIAPGDVDTRSIVDVRPVDLAGYTQCHFFAGLGGWSGALRLAGVADTEPVWTGSCPCQPFSLAGKQKGFADERHLWPIWRELIRERRPAKILGEQVASASQWLRLVRSDLEALGYAVGAIPVEAASAGADHLRDRFWFVANGEGERGREVLRDVEGAAGCRPGAGHPSHGGEIFMAYSYQPCASEEWQQRGRQQCGPGCNPAPCDGGDMADALRNGARDTARSGDSSQGTIVGIDGHTSRAGSPAGIHGAAFEWVIGADGKARRVKPGIRLLAHGIPARVAKLRALGNAIDLRPAAAFIGAAMMGET